LFPPLGLATVAAYLEPEDEAVIVDEHVEPLRTDDEPDLVLIQVYITNAYRSYRIADRYRAKGIFVALGGLHVTSLPQRSIERRSSLRRLAFQLACLFRPLRSRGIPRHGGAERIRRNGP
jgi:radical SAM superfamily enzyme YgiQ (UPF0313 family)